MDYGEDRSQLIGQSPAGLITVIYTERGELFRIISARRATRRDYDRYYRENSQK